MEPKSNNPKAKKLIIVVSIIGTIILGLIITSYCIVHSYISKINIVEVKTDAVATFSEEKEPLELAPEPEDNPQVPDSPVEDINTVENKILENMEENSTPIVDNKDVLNILLIGSDTRSSTDRGRSDSMIIISINDKTKTITATSIMRDIYIQISGKKDNRINASYAFGGADLLMDTIEQNFKIKIDRYAMVDFNAFKDVVDSVGGVTMKLTANELPFIKGDMKLIDNSTGEIKVIEERSNVLPGTYYLDGEQALYYARIRYTGNSDFDRTGRQRKILEKIFINVKDLGPLELSQLLKVILPQITTNLSEGEILSLILSLPKVSGYDLKQCRIPVDGTYQPLRIRGMAVLGIDFKKNIQELHSAIYGDVTEE
jgi:LCP family protein required for cell wall assembly